MCVCIRIVCKGAASEISANTCDAKFDPHNTRHAKLPEHAFRRANLERKGCMGPKHVLRKVPRSSKETLHAFCELIGDSELVMASWMVRQGLAGGNWPPTS